MVKNATHILLIMALALALMFTISACAPDSADVPDAAPDDVEVDDGDEEAVAGTKVTKIGVATSSGRSDFSWGQEIYEGIQKFQSDNPDVEVFFLDAVAMADHYEIATDFADMGCELILGLGYEYIDVWADVAWQYPDTYFAVSCAPHPGSEGYPPNLASGYFREEEPGYLAGVIAALMTETGKVGFMSGGDIPCVAKPLNMFRQGVYDTNPDVEVLHSFVGAWADPALERETAEGLYDMGCDIVFALWQCLGVIDVAQERDVYMFGSHMKIDLGPDVVLGDYTAAIGQLVEFMVEKVESGTFEARPYMFGVEGGFTDLKINYDLVPPEVVEEVEAVKAKISSGEIEIPKLIRVMPAGWPAEPVEDIEEYAEPIYELIYVD